MTGSGQGRRTLGKRIALECKRHGRLYLMLVLPVTYLIIFQYIPMNGVLIAFQDYSIRKGVFGSRWVGLANFQSIFTSPIFYDILRNTVILSVYGFLAGFPVPILLALSLNETRNPRYRKVVQMVTYAPYFISTVVMVSIILQFLHLRNGMMNNIIVLLGGTPINFMGVPTMFRSIFVWSGVWQSAGYSAVIYLAALSGIDPALQEAAIIDGATRPQRVRHVDLPSIMPTIIISIILAIGRLLNVGFEKAYLMQNDLNLSHSEIISTYVYKRGLQNTRYSYSTAMGLFNSVSNLILLFGANWMARRFNDTSLW